MGGRSVQPGLRERKKRATRARLIDAAANLVGEQGYEATTVQQIADAVEVSPRTVAHYFPTKDQMLLAQVHAYAEAVGAELSHVPRDVNPLEAMLAANVSLMDRLSRQDTLAGAKRIATLLRTMHVVPTLQSVSNSVRSERLTTEMARRMGAAPGDRCVELVFAVWAAISSVGWSRATKQYLTGEVDTAALPDFLAQRLAETFDEFVTLTA